MRKILTVASSEFQTAVRSKAFLVGIAIMPVLILASIGAQKIVGDRIDREERRVAVLDHTDRLYPLLEQAASSRNADLVAKDGSITGPRFVVERAAVAAGGTVEGLRLDLSKRVLDKALVAFVELPEGLLRNDPTIRYHTNNPTYEALPRWLERDIGRLVIVERVRTTDVDLQALAGLLQPIRVSTLGVLERDAAGRVLEGQRADFVRSYLTPLVMMLLMFTIVISTASPLLNSVMEEKMTRISEVLLGSVTPFQLMMGKLLGVIGVSLVLAVMYLSAAYGVAHYHGYADAVSIGQIVWFIVYLVLAMFIYGSLFIAIGAAATDLKDAQGLMTPVMVLFMAPLFVWMPVLRAPENTMSVVASLVPFATPVLMTLRLALKPSPAVWQIALSFVLTGLTTVVLVWAAGRIFRVGILMQGKSATFGEMFRWVRAA